MHIQCLSSWPNTADYSVVLLHRQQGLLTRQATQQLNPDQWRPAKHPHTTNAAVWRSWAEPGAELRFGPQRQRVSITPEYRIIEIIHKQSRWEHAQTFNPMHRKWWFKTVFLDHVTCWYHAAVWIRILSHFLKIDNRANINTQNLCSNPKVRWSFFFVPKTFLELRSILLNNCRSLHLLQLFMRVNCSFKQHCLLSRGYRSNIYSFIRVQFIKPRADGAVAVYAKKHLETLQALLDNWTNIIDEVFKSYIKYCHRQQKQTNKTGHNQQ